MARAIEWTEKMDALLGTMPDVEVASALGLCRPVVRWRREELGIPCWRSRNRRKFTPEIDALLGVMSDTDVSAELGVSAGDVRRRRRKLGIPSWPEQSRFKWTPEADALLGVAPDLEVAVKLGLSNATVANRRNKLGIESWQSQNRVLPEEVEAWMTEAGRFYAMRRRHQQVGVSDTLTYKQWSFACEYFNHCCAYCGAEAFLTEDHLVPLSKDGPRTVLNIIPACASCNCSKGSKRAHLWIYEKFGAFEGKRIINKIVAYLTHVEDAK